jgi:hypothetical protein
LTFHVTRWQFFARRPNVVTLQAVSISGIFSFTIGGN